MLWNLILKLENYLCLMHKLLCIREKSIFQNKLKTSMFSSKTKFTQSELIIGNQTLSPPLAIFLLHAIFLFMECTKSRIPALSFK